MHKDTPSPSTGTTSTTSTPLLPQHAAVLQQVQQARQAMRGPQKNAALASQSYLRILATVPDLQDELEQELADALRAYTTELIQPQQQRNHHQQQQQFTKALWLMDKATSNLPTSKRLFYEKGRLCYQSKHYLEALTAFQRALEIDPHFYPALDALENICNLSVDRWHFRMLNDKVRNETYQRALQQVLAEETKLLGRPPRVLDIGAGTGLLSWMARQAGAGEVIACETNPVLCSLAQDFINANAPSAPGSGSGSGGSGSDSIQIINQSSYDLQLAEPVDVIVTELMDSGLLGEHILPVLRHARQHLRPGGRIIPQVATVYAVLIESEEIRRRSHLLPEAAAALFGHNNEARSGAHALPVVAVDEAYTCENLSCLPHRRLTQPMQVLELHLASSSSSPVDVVIDLQILEAGQADAVAIWFDLDLLGDKEKSCSFSTMSERPQNGWDQGIYFLPPDSHRMLEPGMPCQLRAAVVEDQLSFALVPASTATPAVTSNPPPPKVGEMDLAQLNDIRRLEAYRRAIASTSTETRTGGAAAVVEWSGNYSALGLLARQSLPSSCPVTILTGNQESAEALRQWSLIGCGEEREGEGKSAIHVLRMDAGNADVATVAQTLLEIKGKLPQTTSKLCLLHDLVEGSGLIRQGALQEVLLARDVFSSSSSAAKTTFETTMIPHAFSVMVQALEAPVLIEQNKVGLENVLGFPLQALNVLGVRKFRELILDDTTQYRLLSAATVALKVDLRQVKGDKKEVEEIKEEDILARSLVKLSVNAAAGADGSGGGDGTLHAIGFWFHLHLDESHEGTSLSTGPCSSSGEGEAATTGAWTSYRQGAILVGGPEGGLRVKAGQEIELEVLCTRSSGVEINHVVVR